MPKPSRPPFQPSHFWWPLVNIRFYGVNCFNQFHCTINLFRQTTTHSVEMCFVTFFQALALSMRIRNQIRYFVATCPPPPSHQNISKHRFKNTNLKTTAVFQTVFAMLLASCSHFPNLRNGEICQSYPIITQPFKAGCS